MSLSNLNLQSFRAGVRDGFQKKAGIASAIGSGLEWLAPQTTNNFLRPAWHGIKKEFENPNWSVDSLFNAAGKGVEASRFSNIENKVAPYGITFNKDQYGALNSNDPVDFMGSLKNMGSNALGWAQENPGKLLGGLAAAGGVGYMLNSLFSSPQKKRQAPAPQETYYYNPPQYQAPEGDVGTLAKYKFGSEHNPLDFRKYLSLQKAVPLTYHFATKLPEFMNSGKPEHHVIPALPAEPLVRDIHVSAEDKKLKKLLQKPEMRDYIVKLMQPI